MQNRSEHQLHLAADFVAANQDRVASVSSAAAKMADVFLGRLASKVLRQSTLTNLQALASPETIADFGHLLRQHAVDFGRLGVTSAYWDLVDGIASLGDATDARWPYMTQEKRGIRLTHAQEHFELCARLLEGDVAKICA